MLMLTYLPYEFRLTLTFMLFKSVLQPPPKIVVSMLAKSYRYLVVGLKGSSLSKLNLALTGVDGPTFTD